MKVLILTAFLFWPLMAAELWSKKTYLLDGKLHSLKEGVARFSVNTNSTARTDFTLKTKEGDREGVFSVRFCLRVEKECDFRCEGELLSFKKIAPWEIDEDPIKKVGSCD